MVIAKLVKVFQAAVPAKVVLLALVLVLVLERQLVLLATGFHVLLLQSQMLAVLLLCLLVLLFENLQLLFAHEVLVLLHLELLLLAFLLQLEQLHVLVRCGVWD
jgi:hypothetical protein